jgi:NB-ARC domain
MGRPERPLSCTTEPIAAFAHDLRELRRRAGNPSYRELARTALFAPSVLSSAASGYRLPTLPVTLAFVAACGGDRAAWERRWRKIAGSKGTKQGAGNTPPHAMLAPAPSPPAARLPTEPAGDAGQPQLIGNPVAMHAHPAQLPLGTATFVGRAAALTAVTQIIGRPGQMKLPLVINGLIGAGKTTFALRLASDLAAAFPDGQLYADLSICGPGGPSPDEIMQGFLRALGVPTRLIPDDRMQRTGLYRSLLAQRRLFVLLENAYDESQIRPLLGGAFYSQIVVTTSARLLGLDGVHRIELSAFTRQESVSLLGLLAGPERVQAERTAADAIAELCGDLPLAVNIIGRKIAARPEWTLSQAARLLADHDRLMNSLTVGDVSVRDRFCPAYGLLPSACRRAIHHIARGGEKWATAGSLAAAIGTSTDSAEELLESLADAGLCGRGDAAGRYHVPAVVGGFAAAMSDDAMYRTVRLPRTGLPDRLITA